MRMPLILLALAVVLLVGCSAAEEAESPARSGNGTSQTTHSAGGAASSAGAQSSSSKEIRLAAETRGVQHETAKRNANERPLPSFEGRTLSGTRLSISSLIGRRLMIFFFNPEMPEAKTVARAVAEVAQRRGSHNFRLVGVGIGSDASTLRSFVGEMGLDFPIIDDSNARITSLLRLQGRLLILGVDAEGYVSFAHPGFDTQGDDASQKIAQELRESLRIASPTHAAGGALIEHPTAPGFQTRTLAGADFDFSSLKGRPVVLMFFLHTCSHCHHALEFFRDQLAKIPEAKRPELVAITIQNRPTAVRIALDEAGVDFFEPLVDDDQRISRAYGVRGGVPDIALIDAAGQIIYRSNGWRDERDPALMRMYLSRISGEKIPMLLSRKGFAGNDVCSVCHEQQAATWKLTSHSRAYDTLVTHGQERDPECVSCHVVGFDEPGGWSFSKPEVHFENVGCETCHGRGGPHLSPDFLAEKGYAAVCDTCHDKKHSLGFEFATFLPGVSHAVLAGLSSDERAARLAGHGGHERTLLPTTSSYVGSEACQSCHEPEYATWSKSGHAHALASLASKGATAKGQCLACHTTGYALDGGFPANTDASSRTDLARVGCESCHGPGGDHVADGAKRLGSILSLGDKCDSCVILQICGTCHDDVNDPGFEFEVQAHIERQRHGTTEAGTGAPLGAAARLRDDENLDRARIAEALHRLGLDG